MKCFYHKEYKCSGKLIRYIYELPFYPDYLYYCPIIFTCDKHSKNRITWIDALNSRSNVLVSHSNMAHTTELTPLQSDYLIIGICEKIIFCSECNGIGGINDALSTLGLSPCKKCNSTGREI